MRRRQRGFAMLIVYGLLAAGAAAAMYMAWSGFKDSIGQPYREAQRLADQAIVDKAERAQRAAEANAVAADGERDNAKKDTEACVAITASQSKAIESWRDISRANAAAAREAKAAAQREASAAAPRIADLQAKAAAAPKLMACEEELGKAKDVLRDALRQRRGLPTGPPK